VAETPEIGQWVEACFDGSQWHRGKVIKRNPGNKDSYRINFYHADGKIEET
jgi:hypothetical protein